MVDEAFNKVKANIGTSCNTKCTMQRAFAVPIDTNLATQTHHYNEVQRDTQPVAFTLADSLSLLSIDAIQSTLAAA